MTVAEQIQGLIAEIDAKRQEAGPSPAGREYSLAITHLEDAQVRFTKGLARQLGIYGEADLEAMIAEEADPGIILP